MEYSYGFSVVQQGKIIPKQSSLNYERYACISIIGVLLQIFSLNQRTLVYKFRSRLARKVSNLLNEYIVDDIINDQDINSPKQKVKNLKPSQKKFQTNKKVDAKPIEISLLEKTQNPQPEEILVQQVENQQDKEQQVDLLKLDDKNIKNDKISESIIFDQTISPVEEISIQQQIENIPFPTITKVQKKTKKKNIMNESSASTQLPLPECPLPYLQESDDSQFRRERTEKKEKREEELKLLEIKEQLLKSDEIQLFKQQQVDQNTSKQHVERQDKKGKKITKEQMMQTSITIVNPLKAIAKAQMRIPIYREEEFLKLNFDEPKTEEIWEEIEFKKIGKIPQAIVPEPEETVKEKIKKSRKELLTDQDKEELHTMDLRLHKDIQERLKEIEQRTFLKSVNRLKNQAKSEGTIKMKEQEKINKKLQNTFEQSNEVVKQPVINNDSSQISPYQVKQTQIIESSQQLGSSQIQTVIPKLENAVIQQTNKQPKAMQKVEQIEKVQQTTHIQQEIKKLSQNKNKTSSYQVVQNTKNEDQEPKNTNQIAQTRDSNNKDHLFEDQNQPKISPYQPKTQVQSQTYQQKQQDQKHDPAQSQEIETSIEQAPYQVKSQPRNEDPTKLKAQITLQQQKNIGFFAESAKPSINYTGKSTFGKPQNINQDGGQNQTIHANQNTDNQNNDKNQNSDNTRINGKQQNVNKKNQNVKNQNGKPQTVNNESKYTVRYPVVPSSTDNMS